MLKLYRGGGPVHFTVAHHNMMRSSFCDSILEIMVLLSPKHQNGLCYYSLCWLCLTVLLLLWEVIFFVLLLSRDDKVLTIVNTQVGDHHLPWFPQRQGVSYHRASCQGNFNLSDKFWDSSTLWRKTFLDFSAGYPGVCSWFHETGRLYSSPLTVFSKG